MGLRLRGREMQRDAERQIEMQRIEKQRGWQSQREGEAGREGEAEAEAKRQIQVERDRGRRKVRHSTHWCHVCRQVYSWGMIGVIAREGARPEFTHGESLKHKDQLSAARSSCQLLVEVR